MLRVVFKRSFLNLENINMSYARINNITFISEKFGDKIQANYCATAPSGFPEAEILTFVRTGPLTASLTSIYPDKAAYDRSADERKKRMAGNQEMIANVDMQEGDVALVHINK